MMAKAAVAVEGPLAVKGPLAVEGRPILRGMSLLCHGVGLEQTEDPQV